MWVVVAISARSLAHLGGRAKLPCEFTPPAALEADRACPLLDQIERLNSPVGHKVHDDRPQVVQLEQGVSLVVARRRD